MIITKTDKLPSFLEINLDSLFPIPSQPIKSWMEHLITIGNMNTQKYSTVIFFLFLHM
jgi:hypothetical protein